MNPQIIKELKPLLVTDRLRGREKVFSLTEVT